MVSQEGIDTNHKVVMHCTAGCGRTGFMIASLISARDGVHICQAIASLTNDYAAEAYQEVAHVNALLANRIEVWETWVLSHQNAFVPTDAPVCPPPDVGCVGCVVSLL